MHPICLRPVKPILLCLFKNDTIKEPTLPTKPSVQSGAGNKLLLVQGGGDGGGGGGGPYLCVPSLPSRSDLQESTEELTHVGMMILGSMDTSGDGGCSCSVAFSS